MSILSVYADDFVITSKSKELLEGEIKPLVEQFLQERGLELSPTKSVITHVEHGFDFRQLHKWRSKSKRPKLSAWAFLIAGVCNHPNYLVLSFRMELVRRAA